MTLGGFMTFSGLTLVGTQVFVVYPITSEQIGQMQCLIYKFPLKHLL